MKNALAVMFVMLFAAAAHAQKEAPLPKDLPPYGTQPSFQPPEVKVEKFENGLTLWLVAQPGLPTVSFRIVVLGGLALDPTDRPGLSELLARALNQGTKTRNAKQIAEEIQSAGGDLSVRADRDAIFVSTSVLSSKTELAAGLLADVLENASFPDSEVALAKRNLSDSLRQREAQPGFQANRALARVLFGSGPYSVIAKPSGPAPHQVTFVARPNSVQTTLVLAGFGPLRSDPDYEGAEVADAIYGGTFTSRLVTNIREDKGYTYSPGSNLATLRQAATLRTQADVRNAVTGASLNEIIYELNRMATTSPTEEELTRAKRSLLGIEAILLQSRGAVAGELADLWLNGLGPDAIGRYNRKINATTAEDVDAIARKYFPD